MSLTRGAGLTMALDEFLRSSPDVEAAAVVSSDGLPMASALPTHLEEDRLGAMAAAMLSLGERASETLGRGRLQQVFVEGSQGYVFLMAAGDAVLCAITRQSAKIGLILYEMHRASASISKILEVGDASSVVAEESFSEQVEKSVHIAPAPSEVPMSGSERVSRQ